MLTSDALGRVSIAAGRSVSRWPPISSVFGDQRQLDSTGRLLRVSSDDRDPFPVDVNSQASRIEDLATQHDVKWVAQEPPAHIAEIDHRHGLIFQGKAERLESDALDLRSLKVFGPGSLARHGGSTHDLQFYGSLPIDQGAFGGGIEQGLNGMPVDAGIDHEPGAAGQCQWIGGSGGRLPHQIIEIQPINMSVYQ